ncbi:MAG TPA: TrkA family potassium uptake protein [Spirochaetota bacterium]|nr:TrkA family potassium uptake protein [Spirochaetota bacterium]HOM38976.1 TrkA family potassium uptake protein [Spirochaetota bacterium]HPQ48364.1 TrkA family potassium uptake protein [Spirochaetota bacterium]
MEEALIIGLGVFGKSVAENLYKAGIQVTAIDIHEESLQEVAEYLKEGLKLDATIEGNIKMLGIERFDIVFVCIGENMQSSFIITRLLNKNGAKRIIARSNSAIQSEILMKLGASKVVMPEIDMGKQVVEEITTNFEKIFKLSDNIVVATISVENKLIGKSLIELNIRNKYNINIVAIEKRYIEDTSEGEKIKFRGIKIPKADYTFEKYDLIYVIGEKKDIERFIDETK